jgi:hypothetical protein
MSNELNIDNLEELFNGNVKDPDFFKAGIQIEKQVAGADSKWIPSKKLSCIQ